MNLQLKHQAEDLCIIPAINVIQIIIDQKQLENVEYFNYSDSMRTNNARCTREIKTTIVMAKTGFNQEDPFHLQIGL